MDGCEQPVAVDGEFHSADQRQQIAEILRLQGHGTVGLEPAVATLDLQRLVRLHRLAGHALDVVVGNARVEAVHAEAPEAPGVAHGDRTQAGGAATGQQRSAFQLWHRLLAVPGVDHLHLLALQLVELLGTAAAGQQEQRGLLRRLQCAQTGLEVEVGVGHDAALDEVVVCALDGANGPALLLLAADVLHELRQRRPAAHDDIGAIVDNGTDTDLRQPAGKGRHDVGAQLLVRAVCADALQVEELHQALTGLPDTTNGA